MRDGRGMNAAGHQTGEVRHVDEKKRSGLVRDLPHAGKIKDPGISAAAADDQLRLLAYGNGFQFVVVDPLRLPAYAVRGYAVELAGETQLMPMGEMAAVGQVQ